MRSESYQFHLQWLFKDTIKFGMNKTSHDSKLIFLFLGPGAWTANWATGNFTRPSGRAQTWRTATSRTCRKRSPPVTFSRGSRRRWASILSIWSCRNCVSRCPNISVLHSRLVYFVKTTVDTTLGQSYSLSLFALMDHWRLWANRERDRVVLSTVWAE